MEAQLKKGVLEFCVMHSMRGDDLYGYEVMRRITAAFPETSEQTVYTILRRLLRDGYTECYSQDSAIGPPRKYYRLTQKGRAHLKRWMADWKALQQAVAHILSA